MFKPRALAASVVAILVAVGILWTTADRENQQLVDELARQQQARQWSQALDTANRDQFPEAYRLTGSLRVTKAPHRAQWTVHHSNSSAVVVLPFPPSVDGQELVAAPAAVDAEVPDAEVPDAEVPDVEVPDAEVPDAEVPESEPTQSASEIAAISPAAESGFLGAQACAQCHPAKHQGFVQTSHHQTSSLATPATMQGSFLAPDNQLQTSDPLLDFVMNQQDGRFTQTVQFAQWRLKVPIDIVTGSAKFGQSYLYWHDDALHQAYVSYLTKPDAWIPSPGYTDSKADFTRQIRLGCLECHVTYIEQKRPPNFYHRDSAIWGISCERCHGPGRQHVEHHRDHPDDKIARHITHPAQLPRERQLDICGQCHSGSFDLSKAAFSFRPGDTLAEFHRPLHKDVEGVGGIHTSNQLTRLKMSACFQQSQMTCTSCHNPHEFQRGDKAAFSRGCLNCHQSEHCGMSGRLGSRITEDCVSCHMPVTQNEDMSTIDGGGFDIPVADHFIRIDRPTSERFLPSSSETN